MDALQALRALALDSAPTADFPVCLDREKRLVIIGLRQQYQAVKERLDGLADSDQDQHETLDAEPLDERLRRDLATIEARLQEAEDAAAEVSMVLIFKRLPATADSADAGETSYHDVEAEHTDDQGAVDQDAVADALMPLCYLRTDSVHGDLGLTWSQAARQLDSSDLAYLRAVLIGHHRMGARIPFDPRSSGQPATT